MSKVVTMEEQRDKFPRLVRKDVQVTKLSVSTIVTLIVVLTSVILTFAATQFRASCNEREIKSHEDKINENTRAVTEHRIMIENNKEVIQELRNLLYRLEANQQQILQKLPQR